MKKIILIIGLCLITPIFANDSIPKSELSFFDDCGGYLIFGEKIGTSGSFIRRADCKDDCPRYAKLGFDVRLIKFKNFFVHLFGYEDTYMAGTRDLFFSAPVFQDYYLNLNTWQNVKFLKFGAEFCHFCGHYIDTLPAGDSIESWERLQINCLAETEWKKGVDYPAGNLSAQIGLAKYFPLTDCNWQYGLNFGAELSIALNKHWHAFANLSNEIKFAPDQRQSKPEFRLGIMFKSKLVNAALNSVNPLYDNKSSGWEIKIFK